MSGPTDVRAELLRAIDARDANAFECAVAAAFGAGLPVDLANVLAAALLMPWHTRHEDLATALQRMKDPGAIDALFEAALSRHDYLDYDEFFGLARKCTWALADIGTPAARDRLRELGRAKNATIAGYAQKLDSWEKELPRKRA